MLSTCLEHIEPIFIAGLTSSVRFLFVVCLCERTTREVKGGRSTLWDMLWVIVLGLSIFKMVFFIDSVVMIVIIERVYFVSIAFGGRPHLIGRLKLFSLFCCRVRTLRITLVPSVTHYLVYHFYFYL